MSNECDVCGSSHELELSSKCHPGTPFNAEIDDDIIFLACAECGKEVFRGELMNEHTPAFMAVLVNKLGDRATIKQTDLDTVAHRELSMKPNETNTALVMELSHKYAD